jgi:hypothetical protein
MRTDIAKLSFDELNRYVGVFHQMGRHPLESDLNEQNELLLRLLQRLAGDAVHTGSPNHGFRVDTRVLVDAMDRKAGWAVQPATAALFIDYFDRRTGDGSLVVDSATSITKTLPGPLDLRGARAFSIAVKGGFAANALVLALNDGSTTEALTMSELAAEDGWRIFRALPAAASTLQWDRIAAVTLQSLDSGARYAFDALKLDASISPVLAAPTDTQLVAAAPATAVLALDDDQRIDGSLSLKATGATSLTFTLPAPRRLTHGRRLTLALRTQPAAAALTLQLADATAPTTWHALTGATSTALAGGWTLLSFTLPQAVPGLDFTQIAALRANGLNSAASYWFGPLRLEADLERDLVIMGGDGTAEGAGRFYGHGAAALKASHETYLNQPDLPAADPAVLAPVAAGQTRIDWAYLELFERALTYVEQPDMRESALEGADTCTRTQLVAQVRILNGAPIPATPGAEPAPPAAQFAQLPRHGGGKLSTKDTPAAALDPCADPCEPSILGPYVGEDNRLFRVEVHASGDLGGATPAWLKWSRDNGAVTSALIADAAAGATAAVVEKPELFAPGDLIELSDDLVELGTGPYAPNADPRSRTRGELRRIVTVNLQTRTISWADAGASNPARHAPLPQPLRVAYHAKITHWDGEFAAATGDRVLADGVTIELTGSGLLAGDYWLFTTRTVTRSVELLIEAPPRGTRRGYYLLAAIRRSRAPAGAEQVIVDDLRPRFAPLPQLDASRIAYDPGACARIPDWDQVQTVQQAIDAICRADLSADLRLHQKLLHGYGIVCGLKLRCESFSTTVARRNAILSPGYALDCEGYTVHVAAPKTLDLVQMANAATLLTGGDGEVLVTMRRSVAGDAVIEVREYVKPADLWEEIRAGTLLWDFLNECVFSAGTFLKGQFSPFPSTTLPLPVTHRRVLALINLLWQLVNSASGRYVFLSLTEHDLLEKLYEDCRQWLADRDKTYCAMFEGKREFPPYLLGAALPNGSPGIDTAFGLWDVPNVQTRMKLHPSQRFAYVYSSGHQIQVFDLEQRELVQVLDFPVTSGLTLRDLAFNQTGTEMTVVGTMVNGVDSVFANAAIAADQTHSWAGTTTVVCDIQFVTLETHPKHPNLLFAIGRSAIAAKNGLYRLNPAAIPLVPAPNVTFAATGMLVIDEAGTTAYAAEQLVLNFNNDLYDRVRLIDLVGFNAPVFALVAGSDERNGLALMDNRLFVTGRHSSQPAHPRSLVWFNPGTGALQGLADLGENSYFQLAPEFEQGHLAISVADSYRVRLFDVKGMVLRTDLRIPVQISPTALRISADRRTMVVRNAVSNTLSVIDLATVFALPRHAWFDEPPLLLADYRTQAIQAFTDLFSVLVQALKDCFVDKFLVECPTCGRDDLIVLGTVDIRSNSIHQICNFTRRSYVKSFRTWGYWLSAFPVLSVVKAAFRRFACAIL